MKNNINSASAMIFLVFFMNVAQAAEHDKENLQKRISMMQQDLAKKIANEPKERDYGIKISNESGKPLVVSASVGTPQKFNSIFKLVPVNDYRNKTLEGSTAQVMIAQKWPLKIKIVDHNQIPLLLYDDYKKQIVDEFILDLDDAKNYEVANGIGKAYHFFIRKPLKKNYFEILTPAGYDQSIKTDKRWSYEYKPH
jgi:hypothetical protein